MTNNYNFAHYAIQTARMHSDVMMSLVAAQFENEELDKTSPIIAGYKASIEQVRNTYEFLCFQFYQGRIGPDEMKNHDPEILTMVEKALIPEEKLNKWEWIKKRYEELKANNFMEKYSKNTEK